MTATCALPRSSGAALAVYERGGVHGIAVALGLQSNSGLRLREQPVSRLTGGRSSFGAFGAGADSDGSAARGALAYATSVAGSTSAYHKGSFSTPLTLIVNHGPPERRYTPAPARLTC